MSSSTKGPEVLVHAPLQLRTDTTFCAMHADDTSHRHSFRGILIRGQSMSRS